MKNNMSFFKENIAVGFMLFALFLGAGNIIFPPLLGQQAGETIVVSIIGFLITGVGLPLLAIVAVAKNGGDLQVLSNRVNPYFGIIFTSIVYLSIGPLFAIPRTGAVSYQIGVAPLLSGSLQNSWIPLFITTVIFFGITLFLAFNPTKIVDRVGKVLTPALIIVICLLSAKAVISPMGDIGEAQGPYIDNAFGESFVQGYLTMDVLGALVFGIVIVQALNSRGITERSKQVKISIFAGIIAAVGLAFVYIALAYIGVTSTSAIGILGDGGQIISESAKVLYGGAGSVILSATIILACLTTSVGLLSANASFFAKILPKFSYQTYLIAFAVFSLAVANVGLENLISISLPVLLAIYPIAIVLMILSLFGEVFNHSSYVYGMALIFTGVVSLYDGIKAIGIEIAAYGDLLAKLPLYEQSIGWLIPAIIGAIIGFIIQLLKK
ncbi:branched-chain amino acid transport system II carrier protein [Solibacillus sp. FSL H8-0538]|uniref:branched-chain amino acid transport system II carrier protein n=1 Tax=Solibacillus sp. FSL H8-0538 TaxID=2921400 RepID=UPI0030F9F95F